MRVTDWAAAKSIWQAIKESGLDPQDDLVVFVGIGPDRSLDILVQASDDLFDSDDIEYLENRIEFLEEQLKDLVSDS